MNWFDSLYDFWPSHKRRALHVVQCGEIDNYAVFRGDLVAEQPLIYKCLRGASGSTPYDLISTSYGVPWLISERIRQALHGFQGWRTFPVVVYGKRNERLPDYYGLAVTGRCGPIQPERSEWIWCEPPVPGGETQRMLLGTYFDETTWDGSDIFVPEGTAMVVVVEAVKDAIERAKITNASFQRLTDRVMSPIGFDIKEPES